jgi:hypothetical protein
VTCLQPRDCLPTISIQRCQSTHCCNTSVGRTAWCPAPLSESIRVFRDSESQGGQRLWPNGSRRVLIFCWSQYCWELAFQLLPGWLYMIGLQDWQALQYLAIHLLSWGASPVVCSVPIHCAMHTVKQDEIPLLLRGPNNLKQPQASLCLYSSPSMNYDWLYTKSREKLNEFKIIRVSWHCHAATSRTSK